jgi:hypothetical protein
MSILTRKLPGWIGFGIVALIVFYLIWHSPPDRAATKPEEAVSSKVDLDYHWGVSSANTIFLDAHIWNRSARNIKDIEITCTQYGPSGTAIRRNSRTLYELIRAKDSQHIREFPVGFADPQVATASCSITDLIPL